MRRRKVDKGDAGKRLERTRAAYARWVMIREICDRYAALPPDQQAETMAFIKTLKEAPQKPAAPVLRIITGGRS